MDFWKQTDKVIIDASRWMHMAPPHPVGRRKRIRKELASTSEFSADTLLSAGSCSDLLHFQLHALSFRGLLPWARMREHFAFACVETRR